MPSKPVSISNADDSLTLMSLPVIQESGRQIRPSKASRWRAIVLISIHLVIAAHIAHWQITGRTLTPLEPSEAIYFARNGIINAGLIFFALMIVSTTFFGRFFCGWSCHLVALQDLSRWLLAKFGLRPKPLRSRVLAWVPTLAFLYMFIWPAIHRLWIGGRVEITTEITTSAFWATFPGWVVGGATLVVTGFLSVYFLGAKGFCFYACPYGGILAGVDRLAPMKIRVDDRCAGCGHCTAVCTSNVLVHDEVRTYGMVVSSNCMKCLDCVSVCPNDALSYSFGRPSLFAKPKGLPEKKRKRGPRTGEEILLGCAFAAAFFTVRGLYGWIPFLLSLGIAGVVSYLVLVLLRMFSKTDVSVRGHRLKLRGVVGVKGWAFLFFMGVLLLFWAQSSVIRFRQYRVDRDYPVTASLRAGVADIVRDRLPVEGSRRKDVLSLRQEISEIHRLGIMPVRGYTARAAWLDGILDIPERAEVEARLAIARKEDQGGMHLLLAALRYRAGDLEGALGHWGESTKLAPSRVETYLNPAVALANHGRLAEADQVLTLGTKRVPRASVLYYNRGLVRAMRGELSAASADFEKTLDLEPSHVLARENLAGILAELNRHEESAN